METAERAVIDALLADHKLDPQRMRCLVQSAWQAEPGGRTQALQASVAMCVTRRRINDKLQRCVQALHSAGQGERCNGLRGVPLENAHGLNDDVPHQRRRGDESAQTGLSSCAAAGRRGGGGRGEGDRRWVDGAAPAASVSDDRAHGEMLAEKLREGSRLTFTVPHGDVERGSVVLYCAGALEDGVGGDEVAKVARVQASGDAVWSVDAHSMARACAFDAGVLDGYLCVLLRNLHTGGDRANEAAQRVAVLARCDG